MYGLDLFSGIGGITKALEGYVRPIAYCENDRYATAVLLSRMASGDLPTAPIWDDVQTLKAIHLPRPIDIIYGGFPCQDISVAGRGAGLAGKRSGLFFEIVRLVSEIRPSFVFLENVAEILNGSMGTIAQAFTRLRYELRWGVISAFDVGAPHLRERWFLMAHALSSRQWGDQWETKDESPYGPYPKRYSFQGRTVDRSQREKESRAKQLSGLLFPSIEYAVSIARVYRTDHGIQSRMDSRRNMGLGNAVVPAQAREAFERLIGIK